MELTFAKCEQILNTLPIGYYTSRRIGTTLDPNEHTSFYSLMEDSIVVSYPIIAERASKLPDDADVESAVRSMLYHEVSHAILTPTSLECDTAVNIFEDERIESVLRHYYHNVDFRQQLYDLHDGKVPKATTKDQAFFNAVRFGACPDNIKEKIHKLINKYAGMDHNTPAYTHDDINSWHYRADIHRLYNEITDAYEDDPKSFQNAAGMKGDSKKDSGANGNEAEVEWEKQTVSDENIDMPMDGEATRRMVGASLSKNASLKPKDGERLDEFQKVVETIIGNFNKKNSGGSGVNAYSGVFNPRMVTRQDYRYFERSMSTQGNNKFGSCHLNLIIDCSGSYYDNVDLTNGIIHVLSEIERKNRNFSMDVAFINHEFKLCKSVRERKMVADGGNSVPKNMKEIMIKLQKPQTCNYNIILFDGDAMCNDWGLRKLSEYQNRFSAFDMKQTTLISDPDNENYAKNFTSTKVVITKHYTDELIKHITRALTIAFG